MKLAETSDGSGSASASSEGMWRANRIVVLVVLISKDVEKVGGLMEGGGGGGDDAEAEVEVEGCTYVGKL